MIRFCLVFLLLNGARSDVSLLDDSYGYPQPQPLPPFLDEPSTPSNLYIPPLQDEYIPPPSILPIPTYLPPNLYPPLGSPPVQNDDTIAIPSPLYQTPQPQLRVVNMSCVMDNFFRSLIRVEGRVSGLPSPVLEDAPETCLVPGPTPNLFRIDMEGIKMHECGVRRCGSNMCAVVRMPTIRNLKLPEDSLVTLQCAPQDNIVSHVKHIRLAPNTITNTGRGRANSKAVAVGGTQRNFNTRVNLFRKSPGSNSFDQVIQPGSNVQLGEELLLRANVLDGDGWQYSRMGGVVVRSSSSQRAVTLVEENGCRAPGLRTICPQHPRQLTPLTSLLNFRAFLFQGANKGDEMLLSVRMLGCLRSRDCFQRGCDDANGPQNLRFKRDAATEEKINSNASVLDEATNWENLQFRVVAAASSTAAASEKPVGGKLSKEFVVLSSVFILMVIVGVALYVKRKLLF